MVPLIGLCLERECLGGNTCFKKKDVYKYTWERVERGIVVIKALMDCLLISKYARNKFLDVPVYRGTARGISDYYLAEGRRRVAER